MIPVFILSRISSERLPGKCFKSIGGMALIKHMVERCRFFDLEPYVCVPHGDQNANWLQYIDKVHVGSLDPEERIREINEQYKFESYHVLDGDDPYFDPLAIDEAHHFRCKKLLPPVISEAGAGICGTHFHKSAGLELARLQVDKYDYVWFQRLTVDYPEDIEMMHALYRMGCNYMTPRSIVNDIFRRNPDLYKINWFRTEEWKARQNRERHGN